MGKTAVADIITPVEFEAYALERTAAKSAFGQAGIVAYDPAFNAVAAGAQSSSGLRAMASAIISTASSVPTKPVLITRW